MSTNKSTQSLILAGILLSCSMTSFGLDWSTAKDKFNEWKVKVDLRDPRWQVGLGVAGVAAGVGTAVGLYTWLTKRTDEHVLKEAEQVYREAYNNHYATARQAADILGVPQEIDQEYFIYFMCNRIDILPQEEELQKVAPYLSKQGNLTHEVDTLRKYRTELSVRMGTLKRKWQTNYVKKMHKDMDCILKKIEQLLPVLGVTSDCYKRDEAYFRLWSCEQDLRNEYARELAGPKSILDGKVVFDIEQLKHCIVIKESEKRLSSGVIITCVRTYPYVVYANQLTKDVRRLNDLIGHATIKNSCDEYLYPNLCAKAQSLYNDLKPIQEQVVMLKRYKKELKEKTMQDKIDQEQRAIDQAIVSNLKRKINELEMSNECLTSYLHAKGYHNIPFQCSVPAGQDINKLGQRVNELEMINKWLTGYLYAKGDYREPYYF